MVYHVCYWKRINIQDTTATARLYELNLDVADDDTAPLIFHKRPATRDHHVWAKTTGVRDPTCALGDKGHRLSGRNEEGKAVREADFMARRIAWIDVATTTLHDESGLNIEIFCQPTGGSIAGVRALTRPTPHIESQAGRVHGRRSYHERLDAPATQGDTCT